MAISHCFLTFYRQAGGPEPHKGSQDKQRPISATHMFFKLVFKVCFFLVNCKIIIIIKKKVGKEKNTRLVELVTTSKLTVCNW